MDWIRPSLSSLFVFRLLHIKIYTSLQPHYLDPHPVTELKLERVEVPRQAGRYLITLKLEMLAVKSELKPAMWSGNSSYWTGILFNYPHYIVIFSYCIESLRFVAPQVLITRAIDKPIRLSYCTTVWDLVIQSSSCKHWRGMYLRDYSQEFEHCLNFIRFSRPSIVVVLDIYLTKSHVWLDSSLWRTNTSTWLRCNPL